MRLDRTDTSVVGRWWWTVDRANLFALLLLVAAGAVLVFAGSPAVAKRIGLPEFYFVHRQEIFLAIGVVAMLVTSMLPPVAIRRVAVLGFAATILLMMLLPFFGVETKGAHRWMDIAGITIQPSEFMKPCFAVLMAWVCAENQRRVDFPGYRLAIGIYLIAAFLLVIQPDIGMTLAVTITWAIQLFLAGLPLLWVMVMGGMTALGLFGAYEVFPHVAKRINAFLDPSSSGNYQVARSLEAFKNGGWLGRGPGEGEVKDVLPDAHTDFIFSVAGEEFGAIACLLLIGLFVFIILRALYRVRKENDLFIVLAVAGVTALFGIQAVINMGVAVNLFPAKGMTLPFVSYGGSSVVAMAISMGIMLALTKTHYGKKR